MKIYRIIWVLCLLLAAPLVNAQRNSTARVVAKSYDISDNLDLQAVASAFGDSRDLEDFEKRLNDPSLQLSNLDLNGDNYVDYLRVIEVAEGDSRVIVIQAVLGQDTFQDVATIEIEKQRSSNVTVQIVGNPYIYGPNYIYEPYYYRTPVFFDFFWMTTYRPYYSPWYWGYYPTYYSYWAPMPVFRYNRHVYPQINTRNRYVYTDNRRVSRADRMYSGVSRNAYERTNPDRSFTNRNANVTNRYTLDQSRSSAISNRDGVIDRSSGVSRDGSRSNNGTFSRDTNNRSSESTFSRSSNDAVRNTGTTVRSDFNTNRANTSNVNLRSGTATTTLDRSSGGDRSSGSGYNNNSRIERSAPSRSYNTSTNSGSTYRSSGNSSFSSPSSSGSSFSRSSGNSSFSSPSSSGGSFSRSSGASSGGSSSRSSSGGGAGRGSR